MTSKRRPGFTLVEVLIVVVIMAVLAATIIPQFADSTNDAKTSTSKFNLHTLRSQIELYRSQHDGRLPAADLSELTFKTDASGNPKESGSSTFSFGPYLYEIPENPYTNSATVKTATAPFTAGDCNDTDGWLYDSTSGEIAINRADLVTE